MADKHSFRVMTYNTHLFGGSVADVVNTGLGPLELLLGNIVDLTSSYITNYHDRWRAEQFADKINNLENSPDVIGLNEVFDDSFISCITGLVKHRYPYITNHQPGKHGLEISSGLLLLSKHPLQDIYFEQFDWANCPDSLSNKGFLFARTSLPNAAIPNSSVGIVITHMQAGDCEDTRGYQWSQIISFVGNKNAEASPYGSNFNGRH